MNRKHATQIILGLLGALIVLHLISLKFYLYYRISYLDRLMHPLGGFLAGYTILFLASLWGTVTTKIRFLILAMLGAILIGTFWELYEIEAGITNIILPGYAADTLGDMISDVIGGALAFWYISASKNTHSLK